MYVLVIHFGGRTLDMSLVRVGKPDGRQQDSVDTLARISKVVGGHDIDKAIVERWSK